MCYLTFIKSIVFHLFQGGYPAKLKKVLIVTAPLWFKAPFKILRLFVREKLRERVYTVSVAQLLTHIPRESLPIQLGGSLELDHNGWLSHCLQSMTSRPDSPLVRYGKKTLLQHSHFFPLWLQKVCAVKLGYTVL